MKILLSCLFSVLFSTQLIAQGPDSSREKKESDAVKIIFLGDSLTAGYGLEREDAYPVLVAELLTKQGVKAEVVNAGVSGDTTAGGLRRLDWVLAKGGDILVIALGANDGLRGIDPAESEKNLAAIIKRAREISPAIKIAITEMLVPPSMGEDYSERFKAIFSRIAEQQQVVQFPFLLQGVAGNPSLNQADGIHPTAQGQRIIAEALLKEIIKLLNQATDQG